MKSKKNAKEIVSDKSADEADSSYMYNPLTQKPSVLPPIGRSGGFYYFGPPPDAGFSYGVYACDGGQKVVSVRGEEMCSPFDGKPMKMESDLKFEDVKSMVESGALASMTNICTSCGNTLMSNIDKEVLSKMDKLYDPMCGSELPEVLHAMKLAADIPTDKNDEGEEAMKKVKAVVDKLKALTTAGDQADEKQDKALADEIEMLSEDEKKMLAEEMAKDPGLKSLAEELMKAEDEEEAKADHVEEHEDVPEVSADEVEELEEKAQGEEEDEEAKADEEESEEAHASLRKVLKVAAQLKVMTEQFIANKGAISLEQDKAFAATLTSLSASEQSLLASEIEKDDELKTLTASLYEQFAKTDEENEMDKQSLRKVFAVVAKIKVLANNPKATEAEDLALAEEIKQLTASEQQMLVEEIKSDDSLAGVATNMQASEEHEEEKEAKALEDKIDEGAPANKGLPALADEEEKKEEAKADEKAEDKKEEAKADEKCEEKEAKADEGAVLPGQKACADEKVEEKPKEEAKADLEAPKVEDKKAEGDEKEEEEEAHADEEEKREDKESPALSDEEMEEAKADEEEEAKAVHHEPLATIAQLGTVAVADVRLERWNENGENPFYNVTIKGSPVAQIYLLEQPNPEEIRATFVTDTYAEAVAQAIAKVGVAQTLKSVKAKYFSAAVSKSKYSKQLAAKIRNELAAAHKTQVASVRENLLHCIAIVLAGANKNFFADMDNSLKANLYEEMSKAGVYNPVPLIEAAFDAGADKYFEFVLNKAVEYMDMPKEALSEVAKAIGTSSTLPVATPAEGAEPAAPTLAAKLAANSIPVRAGAYEGDSKANWEMNDLRSRIKLGHK